jgi:hypothetical protein
MIIWNTEKKNSCYDKEREEILSQRYFCELPMQSFDFSPFFRTHYYLQMEATKINRWEGVVIFNLVNIQIRGELFTLI